MKEIPVSKGKYRAFVDHEDFEDVSRYSWHAVKGHADLVYVARAGKVNGQSRSIYLHRHLLGLGTGRHNPYGLITGPLKRIV